ncbi:hypothetical protein HPHPP13_0342 [Helicobacter pylori Hp P-13]|uniref:Uncharacterized protein n=1 Tax=Helicobacter pylori Hp P-13b TaxID=992107 RepID=A0ABC9QTA7_HELPX|nr:hypothetical protein HPHPP13_0342 [Helicobacter pylori Hp P-13]EJC33662.1 hypothetical protein HPHPP13B_0335 [Helicobacter pylori Hp P-13b]
MRIGGYFEIILSIIPLTQKDRFLRNYRLLKSSSLLFDL